MDAGNQKHTRKVGIEMRKLLWKLMRKSRKSAEVGTDAEYREFMYAQGICL